MTGTPKLAKVVGANELQLHCLDGWVVADPQGFEVGTIASLSKEVPPKIDEYGNCSGNRATYSEDVVIKERRFLVYKEDGSVLRELQEKLAQKDNILGVERTHLQEAKATCSKQESELLRLKASLDGTQVSLKTMHDANSVLRAEKQALKEELATLKKDCAALLREFGSAKIREVIESNKNDPETAKTPKTLWDHLDED